MALTYKEEKIRHILEELKPLLIDHWNELANNKDIRPLNPDYETYLKLNESNLIRFFSVRDAGKLIGYAIFLISNNIHYKDWIYALCDVYYLDPVYRKTGISFEFFAELQTWLKSFGVKSITIQDKINHSHEKFFNSIGFKAIEQNYEKVL